MSGKWLQTKKNKTKQNKTDEQLKRLEKKYQKAQKQLFTVALLIICSENFKINPPENVSARETCGVAIV